MSRQIVVNEELLEDLISRWVSAAMGLEMETSYDLEASHRELRQDEKEMRESLIAGVVAGGHWDGEVSIIPYTKE